MSEWAQKRFWTKAEAVAEDTGWAVALDARRVRTPAKAPLVVPTRAMADAIAAEWDAQTDRINPLSMPVTRSANAAIDKVAHQRAEVADMLAEYGDADLLCYRAGKPAELVARQAEAWDPLLEWAETALGARLKTRLGVIHAAQDARAIDRLRAQVHAQDPFELAAFHDLVSLSGSLVLGFAVAQGHLAARDAWALSRLDELWQQEQWGTDDEAERMADVKCTDLTHAWEFLTLLRDRS